MRATGTPTRAGATDPRRLCVRHGTVAARQPTRAAPATSCADERLGPGYTRSVCSVHAARAVAEKMAERGRHIINLALSAGRGRDYRLYTDRINPMALDVLGPVLTAPPTGSPHALFLAVGSHNQNSRSLALDGEVAVVLAGWKALAGLPDFITIAGLCTWVESVEELEELFPGYDGLKRRLSRWIRIVV